MCLICSAASACLITLRATGRETACLGGCKQACVHPLSLSLLRVTVVRRSRETNGGLLFLVLLLDFAYVFLQFKLSQSSSGRSKGSLRCCWILTMLPSCVVVCAPACAVFFYFVSTAMFLLGPLDEWISWINLTQGKSPAASSSIGVRQFSVLCVLQAPRRARSRARATAIRASCRLVRSTCVLCAIADHRCVLLLSGPYQKMAWNVLRPGLLILMLIVMGLW